MWGWCVRHHSPTLLVERLSLFNGETTADKETSFEVRLDADLWKNRCHASLCVENHSVLLFWSAKHHRPSCARCGKAPHFKWCVVVRHLHSLWLATSYSICRSSPVVRRFSDGMLASLIWQTHQLTLLKYNVLVLSGTCTCTCTMYRKIYCSCISH